LSVKKKKVKLDNHASTTDKDRGKQREQVSGGSTGPTEISYEQVNTGAKRKQEADTDEEDEKKDKHDFSQTDGESSRRKRKRRHKRVEANTALNNSWI
jgi:hypothetical protein